MKSKFEKGLRNKAYEAVPDKWNELAGKQDLPDKPAAKPEKLKFNKKAVFASAAAIALVIVATVIAVTQSKNKIGRAEEEGCSAAAISYTDENGYSYTCYVGTDAKETTVTYTDENGEVKTEVAYEVTYTDAAGESHTKVLTSDEYAFVETTAAGTSESGSAAGAKTTAAGRTARTTKPVSKVTTTKYNAATGTTTFQTETAVEKNWDSKNTPEKFNTLKINGKEYVYMGDPGETRVSTRTATLYTSDAELVNYDENGKKYTASADVYTFAGFGTDLVLGLKFSKNQQYPYVYVNTGYNPSTLGQFTDDINWSNEVTCNQAHLGTINVPVSSAAVTKYLFSDRNVKNTSANPSGKYISISISCSELNLTNKTLKIYESGYVTTNITGYQLTFFVGKDKTAEFLKNEYGMTFSELDAQTPANTQVTGADGKTSAAYTPE